ncbi:MAG: lysophospholipase [Anaerolineales bacterium]|nr:lysophospholipase [Anaerolineales bacterium]
MRLFPDSFRTTDGLNLRCYAVQPTTGSPLACVILVHGLGDHAQSLPYQNLSACFTARNFAVFGFDLRGHGRSQGRRMYVGTFQELVQDLRLFVKLVRDFSEDSPLFLVGMSLGGLIALNCASQHPDDLSGVVAIAPATNAAGVPLAVRLLMPLLSQLAPHLSINPGLDLAGISRDVEAAKAYTNDPLFQTCTTPRLAAEVLKTIAKSEQLASSLYLPLLLLHGTADTIVPARGTAVFFQHAASSDKKRLTYPGAYHNLLLEPNREQVFTDIVRWIEDRL